MVNRKFNLGEGVELVEGETHKKQKKKKNNITLKYY